MNRKHRREQRMLRQAKAIMRRLKRGGHLHSHDQTHLRRGNAIKQRALIPIL